MKRHKIYCLQGGWPPTAVSGCRVSGGMERSETFREAVYLATQVKEKQ